MRGDIQALRGWAVSIVVLEHSGITLFQSGFLGVDIFFVISGFLITGIILRALNEERFSFRDFYFKRARRILPAAYVTIILTSIFSIWFLTSLEMKSLESQVLGALTYTINYVLLSQVDYFSVAANMKPLLHMWSLAIEEQFYLILPLALWLCPRRLWKAIIILITGASFAYCLYLVQSDPVAAFYSLPTRAWELGIGASVAVFGARLSILRHWYWPSIAIILAVPFLSIEFTHPGLAALLVCLSTGAILHCNNEAIGNSMPSRLMGGVGDISYSLYLVHWPVMVFAYSAYSGDQPDWLPYITILVSVLFAILMYTLVENPCRRGLKPNWQFIVGMITATFVVVSTYFASAAIAKSGIDFDELRAANFGLAPECDYSGRNLEFNTVCSTTQGPDVLVWGDSYAMHLVGGISEKNAVIQATFSGCGPFLGIALKREELKEAELWADKCLAFNRYVLRHLNDFPSVKTVVLATPWRQLLSTRTKFVNDIGNEKIESIGGEEFAEEAIAPTIEAIKATGREVILVAPPPSTGQDMAMCLERIATGKVTFGNSCKIDEAQSSARDQLVISTLDKLAKKYNAKLLRLSEALCSNGSCLTQLDGTPIYRDAGHLSNLGSKIVFNLLRQRGELPDGLN